jgi:hypothetical protein
MRLYHALCALIEAKAFEKLAGAGGDEPQPEGNNFAQAEHAHSFTTEPELHAGHRPEHMADVWDDRAGRISLRWHPTGK